MKEIIKRVLVSSKLLYLSYINLKLVVSNFKFYKKTKSLKTEEVKNQQAVVSLVHRRKESKKSDVCHVIGSGWSLNESVSIIGKDDFVIGFNYAGLISIPFDVYFVEFGGFSVKNTSHQHVRITEDFVSKHTDLIFFKNLWEDKNDISFINAHWLNLAMPIKDRIYPVFDKKYLDSVIEKMLSDQSEFLPQSASSVVTAIILAYKAGFKKIVVHGLDFGGQYFYEVDGFEVEKKYIPSSESESGFYGKTTKKSVHPTSSGQVGMKDIVPLLRKLLAPKGVELCCATKSSPSSNFLPVA
ncbi:hypothetical protein [Thiomicrospira microaerophila]|uniref:hypothetical protein n=1 Tax=Thiomicrospira microaerophila TaxID=406020 RepID=UPI0012FD4C98|nr:hypothetical protein [Thiomicrospira microaerophila]